MRYNLETGSSDFLIKLFKLAWRISWRGKNNLIQLEESIEDGILESSFRTRFLEIENPGNYLFPLVLIT